MFSRKDHRKIEITFFSCWAIVPMSEILYDAEEDNILGVQISKKEKKKEKKQSLGRASR
jgi:hypothetical protein